MIHADGHVQTQDERDRDRAHVMGLYGALAAFTPDDAQRARVEDEDEESLWAARLADPTATAGDDEDTCGRCGVPVDERAVEDKRLNGVRYCPSCHQHRVESAFDVESE